jgi:hypothetical protein
MTHPGSWQARTERRYEGKYGHTERASELGRSKYDQQESNPAHIPPVTINFVNVKDVSRDRERAGPRFRLRESSPTCTRLSWKISEKRET